MADANQQTMANMMQMQMQMQMAAFMAAQSAGPSDGDASLRLLGRAAAKAPASKPAAIADGPCTPEPAAASASASASLSPMNFLAPQSAMPGMPVVNPFDMMSALMRARTDGAGGAAPPLEDGEADGADPPEPEPTARRRRTGGTAKGLVEPWRPWWVWSLRWLWLCHGCRWSAALIENLRCRSPDK